MLVCNFSLSLVESSAFDMASVLLVSLLEIDTEYYGLLENTEITRVVFGGALLTLDRFAQARSPGFANLFAALGSTLSGEFDETTFDHASDISFFASEESDAFESACQEGLAAMSERWRPEANPPPGLCYALANMGMRYRRHFSAAVWELVQPPFLVCHLDFIAGCIHFVENREGVLDVVWSKENGAP
jgi:hypothetical protein